MKQKLLLGTWAGLLIAIPVAAAQRLETLPQSREAGARARSERDDVASARPRPRETDLSLPKSRVSTHGCAWKGGR